MEPSSSLNGPLLLRSDVSAGAEGSACEPGRDASPMTAVLSCPDMAHHHPLRSRSGRDQGDLEDEDEDEPTNYLSPHTRRSLAIQEAYKKE